MKDVKIMYILEIIYRNVFIWNDLEAGLCFRLQVQINFIWFSL
jgi:hypothetical protein